MAGKGSKGSAPADQGLSVQGIADSIGNTLFSGMQELLAAAKAAVGHTAAPQALKKLLFHEAGAMRSPGGAAMVYDSTAVAEFDPARTAAVAESIANRALANAEGRIQVLEKQIDDQNARLSSGQT